MKRSQFGDSQILAVLKQAEVGTEVPDLCREHGLLQAYRQTHYGVRAGGARFALRIGRHSAPLQALQRSLGVDCSAYLTASNPFSRPLTAAQNAARHAALLRVLQRQHLIWLPGVGRHPAGTWPGERSVLVLGLTQDAAALLGLAWQQNAIVCSGADAVPHLVLLRGRPGYWRRRAFGPLGGWR